MSRSFKKHPFVTDNGDTKKNKQIANRKFRRTAQSVRNMDEFICAAKSIHKKHSESWDIRDYAWRMTKQEAIDWYNTQATEYVLKHYPTLDKWLNYWAKCHVRK